jgi:hypothetical protein
LTVFGGERVGPCGKEEVSMFVRGAGEGGRGRGRGGFTVGDVECGGSCFVVCPEEGGAVFVEFVA